MAGFPARPPQVFHHAHIMVNLTQQQEHFFSRCPRVVFQSVFIGNTETTLGIPLSIHFYTDSILQNYFCW